MATGVNLLHLSTVGGSLAPILSNLPGFSQPLTCTDFWTPLGDSRRMPKEGPKEQKSALRSEQVLPQTHLL